MFAGRERELKWLKDALKEDRSSFFAIYGRWGTGKTSLVNEAYRGKFVFRAAGLAKNKDHPEESDKKAQLAHFADDLGKYGHPVKEPLRDWMSAFSELEELVSASSEPKKVIFLDELAWFDTPQSGFLTALESFWNDWMSQRDDVILVVAASAASWILKKVIHNHGGLHNRLRRSIYLPPFTLRECEEFAQMKSLGLTKKQILELYMAFGGVPLYWDELEKGLSVDQNIDALCFAENAPLRHEFDELYDSLFHNSADYKKIVAALATKRKGLTRDELLKESKLPNNGNASEKLDNLESCGIIRSYHGYGKESKDALYQLLDNFTIFHFDFMNPLPNDAHYFENLARSGEYNAWKGIAFERVCLEHVPAIKLALGISGVSTDVCSYYQRGLKGKKGYQIDLLIARKDDVIEVVECKYSTAPYSVSEEDAEKWEGRAESFASDTGTRSAIHLVLISPYGADEDSYVSCLAKVITMKDLFAC